MTGAPSSKKRQESLDRTLARLKDQRRERERRARHCQCRNPLPEMGTYLGRQKCRLCQRLIPEDRQ